MKLNKLKEKVIVFIPRLPLIEQEKQDEYFQFIKNIFEFDGRYEVVTYIAFEELDNIVDFKFMLLNDFIDKRKT